MKPQAIETGTILTDPDACASTGGHDMNETIGQGGGMAALPREASARS